MTQNIAIEAGRELAYVSHKRSTLATFYRCDVSAIDAEFPDVVALLHPNATACRSKFRARPIALSRIRAAADAYAAACTTERAARREESQS